MDTSGNRRTAKEKAEGLCRPLPYHLATAPGYTGLEPTRSGAAGEPSDCAATVPLNRLATAAARRSWLMQLPPMILSHPNDHDNRPFSSSSALAASARAPAWERLAGPESTPESRQGLWSSPDSSPDF